MVLLAAPAAAVDEPTDPPTEPPTGPPITSVSPPTVTGDAVYDEVLRADDGTWQTSPEGGSLTYTYRWLRDGDRIRGARDAAYRLGLDDLKHRLQVEVTAHDEAGESSSAVSDDTARVGRAPMTVRKEPGLHGEFRYLRTVRTSIGRWVEQPTRLSLQWYRGKQAIPGATSAHHAIAPEDVGHRLRARIEVTAPGYTRGATWSPWSPAVRHRVDVRRRVTYHVETRGHVTASVKDFAKLAQQTYADPRGWRGAGVEFRRVAHGGTFTLVLAEASTVPGFSSSCSSMWSCRVGRYVIINQTRWLHASPAWNAAGRSLRDYRHMVVNHETGHWLGFGHATCPGPGRLAPVMMQQSKARNGCTFNPWPTLAEQNRV